MSQTICSQADFKMTYEDKVYIVHTSERNNISAICVTKHLRGIAILKITQEPALQKEGTRAIYVTERLLECVFLKSHARTHTGEEKTHRLVSYVAKYLHKGTLHKFLFP